MQIRGTIMLKKMSVLHGRTGFSLCLARRLIGSVFIGANSRLSLDRLLSQRSEAIFHARYITRSVDLSLSAGYNPTCYGWIYPALRFFDPGMGMPHKPMSDGELFYCPYGQAPLQVSPCPVAAAGLSVDTFCNISFTLPRLSFRVLTLDRLLSQRSVKLSR